MLTTASSTLTPDFRRNRLLQGLTLAYAAVWTLAAIGPHDRYDWLLENLLVFALVVVLIVTYRRFPFSDTSYVLITLFMILHTVGSHYQYAGVPFGDTLRDMFALDRNPYDRIVHFMFGLLLAYPMREIFLRSARTRPGWSSYLAIESILAFSGMYEIIEGWVAQIVSPELGDAYLGTQGDVWDAQSDMALALGGAILCMGIVAVVGRYRRVGRDA